ncbi:hypothetical protein MNBD_GAMMA22-893 [hydrothermal vent metagenome]|uniref:Uncharacterized protein n=1 Tax=hydrothermal vent metagenome TaxID=652676 RepID=A0A3B1A9S8_9ZZZZ
MQTETNCDRKQSILDMINKEVQANLDDTEKQNTDTNNINSNNDALLYIRF